MQEMGSCKKWGQVFHSHLLIVFYDPTYSSVMNLERPGNVSHAAAAHGRGLDVS